MSRKIPYVTLALALIVIVLHVLRVNNQELVWESLSARWPYLYNQPWRIITSPFLHHDLPHLAFNVVFLCLFGWQIERTRGWRTFSLVFFGALIAAHFAYITLAHGWIVGISGGIVGLFGFSLIARRRTPWWSTLTHHPLHLLYFIGLVAPVFPFIANTLDYNIAHLNHLAGTLYGMACGMALLLQPHSRRWRAAVIALPLITPVYSPWQAEWHLVNNPPALVTAEANCQISSAVQDTYVPAVTTIENRSSQAIGIFWLDYQGVAKLTAWVRPGSNSVEHSHIGNAWCVVNAANGKAIRAHIVTDLEETVTIP